MTQTTWSTACTSEGRTISAATGSSRSSLEGRWRVICMAERLPDACCPVNWIAWALWAYVPCKHGWQLTHFGGAHLNHRRYIGHLTLADRNAIKSGCKRLNPMQAMVQFRGLCSIWTGLDGRSYVAQQRSQNSCQNTRERSEQALSFPTLCPSERCCKPCATW